jgi:hypothetical protein
MCITKESCNLLKGLGKVLHTMKLSKHNVLNRVREISSFMSKRCNVQSLLNNVRKTARYGNYIKPDTTWDGIDRAFPFIITGLRDTEKAAESEKRHSVGGGKVFLCGAVIFAFS